jgi:hypothetical protein
MSAIVREGSIRELIENERARSADLAALVAGWRRAPLPELVIRCRALAMADQRDRLPTEVYDAWVQMSAVVTVFGGAK